MITKVGQNDPLPSFPRSEGLYCLSKIRLLKKNKSHSSTIRSVCFIGNDKIASCSKDKTIKVHNLNTFQTELTLEGHTAPVSYISLLSNGLIASSSHDKTIKIWKIVGDSYQCIETLANHANLVFKIIQISNDRMCSCSADWTVKIWESKAPFKLIKTLNAHRSGVKSILETNNQKYIVSVDAKKNLIFWDSLAYIYKKIIVEVKCVNNNGLIEIYNNKIFVGGENGMICIIDASTLQLETNLMISGDIGNIFSFAYLKNQTVLCGDNFGQLIQLDSHYYQKISVNDKAHFEGIRGMLLLNDNKLLTWSEDGSIF